MQSVMIDLETMGTGPRGAIVSIGAVLFDLNTGDLGASIHEQVSLKSCTDHGLVIDASTVLWWMKQKPEAQASWNVEFPKQLPAALGVLAALVNGAQTKKGRGVQVWANAPTFDCAILRSAYSAVNYAVPWAYQDERCVRTLVALARDTGFEAKATPRTGVAHSALDDCLYQIEYCCRAWLHLKGIKACPS